QHAGWAAKAHRRASVHPPFARSDFDSTPVLVGEIKINASSMLGDADVDGTLGRIKLRPCLKQIELRGDRLRAQRAPGRLVILATQPTAKALAANWPSFPVTVDQEIGKGGAGGGVKELPTRLNLSEHVGLSSGRCLRLHNIGGL